MAKVLFVFAEPRTIYDCSRYLCCMQYVLCSSVLWRCNGRYVITVCTRLYSLVVSVLVTLSFAYMLHLLVCDRRTRESFARIDRLVMSIAVIEVALSMGCFAANVVLMQLNAARLLQFYDRLQELDRRLMRDYGANLHYAKLMRKMVVTSSLQLLFYTGAIGAAVAQLESIHITHSIVIVLCYVVITASTQSTCFLQMCQAEMLSIRFRLLQRLLGADHLRQQFPDAKRREQRVETLGEMMLQLYELIERLNKIYGCWTLLSMAHDFTQTTSILYCTMLGRTVASSDDSDGDGDRDYRLHIYLWVFSLPPIYKMLLMPIYFDWALKEGERCIQLYKRLDTHFPESEHIRRLVDEMMLWRLRHKIQFKNILDMVMSSGNSTIVLSVIGNYLFILLQFHMMQQMAEELTEQTYIISTWVGSIDESI